MWVPTRITALAICAAAATGPLTAAGSPAVAFPVPTCPVLATGSANVVTGTSGDDTLVGTAGQDVIDGGGGNDTIYGLGGADVIDAGPGADVVYGGDCDDTISGGPGEDFLFGFAGGDTLDGERGEDVLVGGPGNDAYRDTAGDYCDESDQSTDAEVLALYYFYSWGAGESTAAPC